MVKRPQCVENAATTGKPCKITPPPGQDRCRWHDKSPEATAKRLADSSRGGLSKAYGGMPTTSALAEDPNVAGLDLGTADGLRLFLAATLGALARLPVDVRVCNSIAQVVTAQRGTIEAHDFERRLAELEKAAEGQPRLRAV